MKLVESPIHVLDTLERRIQQGQTIAPADVVVLAVVAYFINSMDKGGNDGAVRSIAAEPASITVDRLKRLTTQMGYQNIQKLVGQTVSNPALFKDKLTRAKNQLMSLYKEFGIQAHNDV